MENKKETIKPTSIRINPKLLEKVKTDADKEKRSVTKQIEYIIERFYGIK